MVDKSGIFDVCGPYVQYVRSMTKITLKVWNARSRAWASASKDPKTSGSEKSYHPCWGNG